LVQLLTVQDAANKLHIIGIGKWLKEGFCILYNAISNDFGSSFENMKVKLAEQKVKEEYLSQTVKELKDEISKLNSKEKYLSKALEELNKY
jgi:cell division protein FtsB